MMKYIDPQTNSALENARIINGCIIPRPIAFVTTKSKLNVVNAAPFSYFNAVSTKPPLISISFLNEKVELKDTLKNILENGEFVVHLVNGDNVEEIDKTSIELPYNESEIDYTSLELVESTKISTPGIKESKVRFECILHQHMEVIDQDKLVANIVIGKIVAMHILEDIIVKGKIDPKKLDPVSRLAGITYSRLGNTFNYRKVK